MSSTPLTTDVLIVGAGPTGLMLALVLAKLGVDHIIVDSKQDATVESRAIGVQARTLEIYEQLGLVDEVLKQGTKATAISPGYLKKALANIPARQLGRVDHEVSVHRELRAEQERATADRRAAGARQRGAVGART